MNFEVEDISKVIPRVDYLLVRANREEKFIHISSDMSIEIDTSFEPHKHAATYGTVISCCEKLSDHLETDMEVKPGDQVFFHYLVISNCIRDKKFVMCNGIPYFMISYGSVYCCKRGEDVIPINGHILVEPVGGGYSEQIDGIYLPESVYTKNHNTIGMVKYVGKPLKGQKKTANPGDLICFTKTYNVPLQYELHSNLDGNKTYYRMKHDAVLVILN